MDRVPDLALQRPGDGPSVALARAHGAPDAVAPGASPPSLEVDGLSVAFEADGTRVQVLDGLSFALRGGEIGCLLGSSGCGKTTALRAVAGFVRPDAGRIRIAGREVSSAAAVLPPERRGLLFVDPAYELAGEFERLLKLVGQIHRRWREGTVAIWYPILDRAPSERFCRALAASGVPALLRIELGLAPYDTPLGMKGSGVIVCNPPYQLDVAARRWLAQLQGILSDSGSGETRVEWLTTA